jgi:hypothetical protein
MLLWSELALSNNTGSISKLDIYGQAGALVGAMMRMGRLQNWTTADIKPISVDLVHAMP